MSLHRFESFIPKNLDDRQEKYQRILVKEERELKDLSVRLQKSIFSFKDLKISDEKELFFINKFKDGIVKIDHKEYPDCIFFFDKKDKYVAEYHSKSDDFWINYDDIWTVLESKYDLNYDQIEELVKAWVEEHFKLRIVATTAVSNASRLLVEEHFKLRPVLT